MSRRADQTLTTGSDTDQETTDTPSNLAADAPLSEIAHPLREKEDSTSAGVMRAGEAGSTSDADDRQWQIEIGTDVICTGGQKLGEVVAVEDGYIVVEKGFFMPEDVFVPKDAIDHYDEHSLVLRVSKDKALHSGWDEEPGTPENDPGPAL
jgi:hypothetical protein